MNMEVSSLMDDELDQGEAAMLIRRLKESQELAERWHEYHLIGDVMRRSPCLSPKFAENLSRRLAEEPTILAPAAAHTPKSNWVALSAAASLAAIAIATWAVLNIGNRQAETVQVVDRLPLPGQGMNPYLLAHQEYSPSTSMHGVMPYVRTVYVTPATSPGQR
jgi:sigma-E factor negative regulatory protein RseA